MNYVTRPRAFEEASVACLLLPNLISNGSLGPAVECFAPDACLLTPDATEVRGRELIRPVLEQLIALRARIRVDARSVVVAGDVAVAREVWRIQTAGARASKLERSTRPTLVMRWSDVEWKLAIAAPWELAK